MRGTSGCRKAPAFSLRSAAERREGGWEFCKTHFPLREELGEGPSEASATCFELVKPPNHPHPDTPAPPGLP